MKRLSALFVGMFVLGLPSMAFADFRRGHSHEQNCNSDYHYDHRPSYGYGYRPGYNWNSSYSASGYDRAIQNGVRSGQLSWREVRELREDQRDIREKAAAYRSDGYLSPRERDSLRDDLQDFRHDLNHELHDGEHR